MSGLVKEMDLERTLRVGYGAAANSLDMLTDPQVREETWRLLGANPNALLDLFESKGRTVEAEARQWLAQAQAEARGTTQPPQQRTIDVTSMPAAPDPVGDLAQTLRRLREGR